MCSEVVATYYFHDRVLMDLKDSTKIAVRCYIKSLIGSQNLRATSDLSDWFTIISPW